MGIEVGEDKEMQEAFQSVINGLKWGKEDGVEVEVIVYAMIYLRDHPGSSIPDAISYGLEEWLK
jgi:hypothetical protein